MAKLQITIPDWLDKFCAWPVLEYRRRKYGYSYRRISLGEGEWALVESADYYRLNNFKWYLSGTGKKFYAFRNIKIGRRRTKMVSMHREIMNFPLGRLVDHANRTSLDNRKANLRIATKSQNSCNSQIDKTNTTSRFRGVFLEKRVGKWIAVISYQRKRTYLGSFHNEIDAARAYDQAAKKYHGEFARLNFPD